MPAFALLGDRNFLIIWMSKSIHEMSRRMELLVLGYLILELTGSAFHVGLVSVFLNAPRPVLSLFAGHIADRFNRRLILIIVHLAYLLSAVAILVALTTGTIGHWFIFGIILFLLGFSICFWIEMEDLKWEFTRFVILGMIIGMLFFSILLFEH